MARSSAKKPVKGKKKKKSGSVTVSMKDVESGGRTMPDGPAHARVVEAELGESSNGNEMFTLKLEVTRGKLKATVFDHLVTTPNALWKLRSLLEAAGVEVPEGDMTISEEDLVDLEFDVEITNEEYEGKDRPKITAYLPEGAAEESEDEEDDEDDSDDDEDDDEEEDEEEDDDDEEEEPPKRKKKAASKKRPVKDDDDDDEEEEEDEDDDDSDDDDEDEEESDDDEEEDEDDEEEEDDEDEDDEPKSRKSKKKGSKKSKPKLRAGVKVAFEDDKGRAKKGVITSIDGDTIFVEDPKGVEWELEEDEITLV
jgi:hypothetical protein